MCYTKSNKGEKISGTLSGYSDKILLVGINCETEGRDMKHHACVIEEYREEGLDGKN